MIFVIEIWQAFLLVFELCHLIAAVSCREVVARYGCRWLVGAARGAEFESIEGLRMVMTAAAFCLVPNRPFSGRK